MFASKLWLWAVKAIALIVLVSFTTALMRYFGKSKLIERRLDLAKRLWYSWSLQYSEMLGTSSRWLFAFIIRKWRTMDTFSTFDYTLSMIPCKGMVPSIIKMSLQLHNQEYLCQVYQPGDHSSPITLVILNSADHCSNYVAHIFLFFPSSDLKMFIDQRV